MKRTSRKVTRALPADRQLLWFGLLTAEEKSAVVRRLADQGRDERDIASLTKRGTEDVRRILAERTT